MFTVNKISFNFFLIISLLLSCSHPIQCQSQVKKIDYTIHSNVINPDTLKGDQKAMFWHFIDVTSQELKSMKSVELKAEFVQLGLHATERARFIKAYKFFMGKLTYHKKDCEKWKEFEYLNPDD